MLIICEDLRHWLNVYLNFSFLTVFLKNRNIRSKIKRSKVTDNAALRVHCDLNLRHSAEPGTSNDQDLRY